MPDSGAGLRSLSVHLRHRGPQQPPQGPAWTRGNYLLDLKPFLCAGRIVTTVAGLGRVPNICSKYGFYIIISEGIVDLHHIIVLYCIDVMSRHVVMVARGSM